MSVLQVPLHQSIDVINQAVGAATAPAMEDHQLDPELNSPPRVQNWGEKSSAVAGAITAHAHRLLASRWQAFYVTSALCFVSLSWLCAALHYHRPSDSETGSRDASVHTLDVLTRQELDKTGPAAAEIVAPKWAVAARPRELRAAVAWAFAACLCLGLVHWALGTLPGLGVRDETVYAAHVRRRLLEVLGVGSGLLAACATHVHLAREGGPRLAEELLWLLGFRGGAETAADPAARLSLVAGAFSFAALLAQGSLLGGDVHNGGQMLNLSGCDAVLVTAVFALYFGEGISCWAVVGMSVIRASSLATCAFMSATPLGFAEIGVGLLSTCLLAAAATCTRLSVRAGASPFSLFTLGCQAAAIMSAFHCAFTACGGGLHAEVGGLVVAFGLGLATCHALGLFCVAKALSYPYAGACTAIWGSNVVIVLAFQAFQSPALQRWPAVAGVVCTAAGVCICATAAGPEPGDWVFHRDLKGKLSISILGLVLAGKEADRSAAF